jgi:hypothetical protein
MRDSTLNWLPLLITLMKSMPNIRLSSHLRHKERGVLKFTAEARHLAGIRPGPHVRVMIPTACSSCRLASAACATCLNCGRTLVTQSRAVCGAVSPQLPAGQH